MKRTIVILVFVLAVTCVQAADFGIGFDVLTSFSDYDEYGSKAKYRYLSFAPTMIVRLSDLLEVSPFLRLVYEIEDDPDNIMGLYEDAKTLYFGGGSGLYFHFVRGKVVEVSTGPRLEILFAPKPSGSSYSAYDSYTSIDVDVWLPVQFDIKFSRNLFLRTRIETFGFNLSVQSAKISGDKENYSYIRFASFNTRSFTQITPYFGFYYMF